MNTQVTQTLTQEAAASLPLGKLSVYFCGGTGVNLAERFNTVSAKFSRKNMAEITDYVIDTSNSNMQTHVPSNVYKYKDKDGFGKARAEDPAAVKKKVPEILASFAPEEFNIVVFGMSGGSGSVIGPFLAREILAQGKNVILLGVVSTDTITEIQNTNDTLGNLETIATSLNTPTVLHYYVNPENGNQAEVDEAVVLDILKLGMLFSRRNARLDQADLRNWLVYTRNREVQAPAKLTSLITMTSDTKAAAALIEDGVIPITVATVAPANSSTRPPFPVVYQATGFIPDGTAPEFNTAVHFAIVDGQIAALHARLDAELKRLKATASSVSFAKSIPVNNKDGLNDMFA